MLPALIAGVLGACDFPTASPIFESHFLVPGESTSLSVTELLPNSIVARASVFELGLQPATSVRTLGELCPAFVPLNGQIAALPACTTTLQLTVPMPQDVSSAVLVGGVVDATLQHDFGFDPTHPPGGGVGSVIITVTNGGQVIGRDSSSVALPSGVAVTRAIALSPGTLSGPTQVSVMLRSPAGGAGTPVLINSGTTLQVTASPRVPGAPGALAISEASIVVSGRIVTVAAATFDLSEVDATLSDRTTGGTLVVVVHNPWNVAGTLVLRITGGSAPVVKSLAVSPGSSTQRIALTEVELQQLLGHDLLLTISGPVSATDGTVIVRPGQLATLETALELTLRIGDPD